MATANATNPKMTLDRSNGSATIELYRAALGPVHAEYYLKAFTRFDAAGKSGPLWNWAAALLTLNWMVFRQLWAAALAYSGAVLATALLLGIAGLVFQVSAEVQWALLGLAALLAIVLPGAYGNAWLYAAYNRKMERALVDCATLDEACALLAGKTAGRKRMGGLLAGNVVLGAALTAIALAWPTAGTLPLNPAQPARALPADQQQSGLAAHSVAAATAPAASAAAAPSLPASSDAPPISATPTVVNPALVAPQQPMAPASRVSQGMVQTAMPAAPAPVVALTAAPIAAPASAPAAPAATIAAAAPVVAKVLAPEPAKPVVKAETAPETDKKHQTAKQTRAEKTALAAQAAKEAKAAKAEKKLAALKKKETAKAKTREASAAAKPQPAKPQQDAAAVKVAEQKYLINVGLFADENNARNAFTKLKDVGLPATSQELKSSKGPRTRVRVGPFETQAEADRAAEKIRSLQLEAAVFQQ